MVAQERNLLVSAGLLIFLAFVEAQNSGKSVKSRKIEKKNMQNTMENGFLFKEGILHEEL